MTEDRLADIWKDDKLINHDALDNMSQTELLQVLEILKKLD